jgi:hypothetical protein
MFLEIAASLVSCEGISQPAREHWPGGRELCKPRPVVIFLAASAQTYPVSGVWVERDDHFPGTTAGACSILKKLGVDAVLAQPFPTLLIFSKSQRFAVRGDHLAQTTIKSAAPAPVACKAIERIAQLYAVEKALRGRSDAERRAGRQAHARPQAASLEAVV